MEKRLMFFLVSLMPLLLSAQKKPFLSDIYSYLENTKVFELNQDDGHVPLVPYLTVAEALKNDRYKASGFMSLNGTWKFHFSNTPEGTPFELFYTEV